MNIQLDILIKLNQTDTAIKNQEKLVKKIPEDIAAIDSKLKHHMDLCSDTKARLTETEKNIRKNEQAIEDSRQQQGKYRAQLFKLKSNREYTALNSEIELLKKKVSGYETEILELMETIDELKVNLIRHTAELKELESVVIEEKANLEKNLIEEQKQLETLMHEREMLSRELSEDVMEQYQRICRQQSSAVAEIIRGTCGGCYVRVRPQLASMVRSNESLINCESCRRFLYWSDVSE